MIESIQVSSIASFAELARKHPALLNIGSLTLLKTPIQKATPAKSCNCSKKAGADLSAYRPQFEAAMTMLSADDKNRIKTILNVANFCYFAKNSLGQINKTCF